MAKKTIIKLVYLNNKTRQGWYIYKRSKGKSHYYKKREGITEKQTIKYYSRKKNQHKNLQPIKTRTYGNIETQIQPGITTTTITQPHTITTNQIQKHKKELLQPSIKNQKALQMIITQHNMDKIKHRLEYKIQATDNQGNILAEATKTNISLEDAIKAAKDIQIGEQTDMTGTSPSIKKLRETHGFTTQTIQDGTIANITIKATFRKQT